MPNQVDKVRKMLKRPIKRGKNIFHEGVTGLRAPGELAWDKPVMPDLSEDTQRMWRLALRSRPYGRLDPMKSGPQLEKAPQGSTAAAKREFLLRAEPVPPLRCQFSSGRSYGFSLDDVVL